MEADVECEWPDPRKACDPSHLQRPESPLIWIMRFLGGAEILTPDEAYVEAFQGDVIAIFKDDGEREGVRHTVTCWATLL